MSRLSSIPLPVRVAIVAMVALLLSLLLVRPEGTVSPASAATNAPISGQCTGAKQGVIKGDVTQKGREGTYAITSLTHGITAPYDTSTGLITGRSMHKPVVFTTNVSQATPKLISSLVTNENLTSCTFNFWRLSPTGVEQNYFRIRLTNAHVVDYRFAGRQGGADTVTFSLVYSTITWTYVSGGVTATDDWQAPVG